MMPILGKCYITQGYGKTLFAQSETGARLYKNFGGIHPGVDLGTGGINAGCISLVTGEVVRAKQDGGWGNHVEICCHDGWNRQHAHLSSISVKVGEKVIPGKVIGHVGNTGSSTGIHLHYGHRKWKTFYGWEYRDSSVDFEEKPTEPVLPTKKLIKSNRPDEKGVFVWNGMKCWGLPDWETKLFLFGNQPDDIELVEHDVLQKLPLAGFIPSLK